MKKGTSLETLGVLRKVIKRFREMAYDMPTQTAETFLVICLKDGITVGEIAVELDMAKSSASRNVQYLSVWHRLNKPGLGLVEAIEPLENRRIKEIRLTARGRALRDEITEMLR